MTAPARPPNRLNGACCWGTPGGPCGRPGRPYPGGSLCDERAPWARAGRPEPIPGSHQ